MAEQEWWTSPLEDDNGNLIMVTGRGDVEKFYRKKNFSIRFEVTISYQADETGMPVRSEAIMLDDALTLLQAELDKDPVVVLTGVYTGGGERNMVLYGGSTNIFTKIINRALASLPLLPLKIEAYNDPEWEEYDEMREISEIQ